jgi:hypothetical protein
MMLRHGPWGDAVPKGMLTCLDGVPVGMLTRGPWGDAAAQEVQTFRSSEDLNVCPAAGSGRDAAIPGGRLRAAVIVR